MPRPLFKLNQKVALPYGSDGGWLSGAGTIAEMKLSVFAEPSYYVVPFTGSAGTPPAFWHTESVLAAANRPPAIAPAASTPMGKLRARRKSKR